MQSQTIRDGDETICASPSDGPVEEAPAEVSRVGRYIVLEEVGRGGMGRVYRARDPQLGREVAIKRLSLGPGRISTEGAARMLREAQAMARLSHPNVVPVYDVERHGAEMFIAMELVEGVTLRQWLDAARRSWPEILRVFTDAGRGIAAAHDAGLIHRDFKPGNVMIGEDGRARVMDFGLARAHRAASSSTADATAATDESSDEPSRGAELTRSGTVMGTPAYMSPEQHGDAQTMGPAADQYAFCVTLWEALYGARPFVADSLRKLLAAKLRGPPRAPAQGRVPGWVHRVVARGLAVDPEARWPSMRELIAALGRDPGQRRRRLVLGVGLVAVAAAGVVVASRGDPTTNPCESAAAEIAGAWDEETRAQVREAMLATKVGYAGDTAQRIGDELDAYAGTWIATHEDACRATHERATQTEDILDRRMACLFEARDELQAVARVLTTDVTSRTVERASRVVSDLPRLERCSDVEALMAEVPPPSDPQVAAAVDAVRRRMSTIAALQRVGRVPEALDGVGTVVDEAQATGYVPIHARALLQQARIETGAGEFERATEHAKAAYERASDAGDDHTAALAAIELGFVLGDRRGLSDEAHHWLDVAHALIRRTGTHERTGGWYYNILGNVLKAEGRTDEAIEAYGKAEEILTAQLGPDDRHVGMVVGNAGIAYTEQHRPAEALPLLQRALELDGKILGPKHPAMGTALTNLGLALHALHRYDEALDAHTRARDIFEGSFGTNHPYYAAALTNMGMALLSMDRIDEAEPLLLEGLAVKEARMGKDHKALVPQLINLGFLLAKREQPEEALRYMARARDILVAHHGEEHPVVALTEVNIGTSHAEAGRLDEGRRWVEKAIAFFEAHDGPDAPSLAEPLAALSMIEERAERFDEAEALLRRAEAIESSHETPGSELALTRFRLAKLQWRRPDTHDTALGHAEQALDGFRAADDPRAEDVRTWLDERRPGR